MIYNEFRELLSLNCKIVELILINPEKYRTIIVIISSNISSFKYSKEADDINTNNIPSQYNNNIVSDDDNNQENNSITKSNLVKPVTNQNKRNKSYNSDNEFEYNHKTNINNLTKINNNSPSRERLNKIRQIEENIIMSKSSNYLDNSNLNYSDAYTKNLPKSSTTKFEDIKFRTDLREPKARERLNSSKFIKLFKIRLALN